MAALRGSVPCPSCGRGGGQIFYSVDDVPTNSVLLLESAGAARGVPRGDIRLAFCPDCGHVHNAAFNPALTEYSGRYESTQAYSPTFNAFHERMAAQFVERFDLHGREIIEIGCGNGEFLVLLCSLGANRGLGFDPAYQPDRIPVPPGTEVRFIVDFYSEKYRDQHADFLACKMTLEHIIDVQSFVRSVRRALDDRDDTKVCFQIPNARYVLSERAFWDVYYEHCSYFTHGSLARLFRRERFAVLDLWTDYDDQYLMVAAQPASRPTDPVLVEESDLVDVVAEVARFRKEVPRDVAVWREQVRGWAKEGRRIAVWGGGSKAVAFLTTLGVADEVSTVVDINPHKAGTFLAGTGHEIVLPERLRDVRPDVVVVMNPVYASEISVALSDLGLAPEVRLVGS